MIISKNSSRYGIIEIAHLQKMKEKQIKTNPNKSRRRKKMLNLTNPKKQKKENKDIRKASIFDLSQEELNKFSLLTYQNPKELKFKETLNLDKLLIENTNYFFTDREKKVAVCFNRTLLDPSLNKVVTEEKPTADKYSELFDSQKFSNQNFDFNNKEDLLER